MGIIKNALKKTIGRVEGPKGAAILLDKHPNTLRSKITKLRIVNDYAKKQTKMHHTQCEIRYFQKTN